MSAPLPPGQHLRNDFPRFGLGKFANRFPAEPDQIRMRISGDVESETIVSPQWEAFPRTDQVSDFHCVTTWSIQNLSWSGVRFVDFYRLHVLPHCQPRPGADLVVLRGADGFSASLPLEDVLRDEVLLADQLNGEPLGLAHGAPLRLVAPAHYGYKNVKHLMAIEFWTDRRHYRFPFPYPPFMDHPRGRVALEERARWVPSWLIRPIYRLLIRSTVRNFARALARRQRA